MIVMNVHVSTVDECDYAEHTFCGGLGRTFNQSPNSSSKRYYIRLKDRAEIFSNRRLGLRFCPK
jgi:hypothetical protein